MTYEYGEKIKQCDLRTGKRRIGNNKARRRDVNRQCVHGGDGRRWLTKGGAGYIGQKGWRRFGMTEK